MFYKQQPDLNWRNPQVRAEMLSVFRFWADRGVDGFRLDVFNEYFKDALFRDNPYKIGIRPFDMQHHIYDADQAEEMLGVVREIRETLDAYPERYAVGETFMGVKEAAARYCGHDKLHGAFNFDLIFAPWQPAKMLNRVLEWDSALSKDAWPTQVLNNHDRVRTATRYRAPENDERLKVAAAMLLTLRGTPFLYYGEEIGMRDIKVSRAESRTPRTAYWPFNKAVMAAARPCNGLPQECRLQQGFSLVEDPSKFHGSQRRPPEG